MQGEVAWMSFEEEWMALGERLKDADPDMMEEVMERLRQLATTQEGINAHVASGSPVARAVLAPRPAPPRSRESH
jgi:hypothetical protein